MYGSINVKFVNAKQAKETYQYRNIKGLNLFHLVPASKQSAKSVWHNT
jgi:hypothetical protein